MNKILGLCLIVFSALTVASCSEKKKDNIIITKKKPTIVKPAKPKKMGDYTQSRTVEWLGNKYTVESKLMADESLPLATDGAAKYYDNRVSLRIMRADGSEFFKRTFAKTDFEKYVDNIYYKSGALLGIVYVETSDNVLTFAASVGNPDKSSDEYVPLVLKVDRFGNVSISKDTQMDTTTDMEEPEEDDGV